MAIASVLRITVTSLGQTIMAVASVLRVTVAPLRQAIMTIASVLRITMAPLGETIVAVAALTRISVPWISGEDSGRATAPHKRLPSVKLDGSRAHLRGRSLLGNGKEYQRMLRKWRRITYGQGDSGCHNRR